MTSTKRLSQLALAGFLTTQIAACGGGSDVSSATTPNEPIQITSSSWKLGTKSAATNNIGVKVTRVQRHKLVKHTLRTIKNYIRFEAENTTPNALVKHRQFLIDIDNNPKTGYQFDSDMWVGKSGADYMIEDNELFKAKTNDSNWEWEWITTTQHFGKTTKTMIELDALGVKSGFIQPLCNNLNVGYAGLDENWQVVEFSPKSNALEPKTIDYCDHVADAVPTISLNGPSVLRIILNDTDYSDPGVTANDREDGDISAQAQVISDDVNINKLGDYSIIYEVQDNTGNKVRAYRKVQVISSPAPITVDNQNKDNEWAAGDSLFKYVKSDRFTSTSRHFKVLDTQNYLYFYASASYHYPHGGFNQLSNNWQIFIDSDDNPTTGYTDNGYDYFLENGVLYKFQGKTPWAWRWHTIKGGVISVERTISKRRGKIEGPVEAGLDKSLTKGWSKNLNMKFITLNSSWSDVLVMQPTRPYVQMYPRK